MDKIWVKCGWINVYLVLDSLWIHANCACIKRFMDMLACCILKTCMIIEYGCMFLNLILGF